MNFLQQIASHFVSNHRDELYQFKFIFPNRRSGIFFRHYLKNLSTADSPLFSPDILTLEELFASLSKQEITDPLLLSFELYSSYKALVAKSDYQLGYSMDSFERFYPLSEHILSDFDDIDKHLVNAKDVLVNTFEYNEIGTLTEALEEEQKKALRNFLGNLKVLRDETTVEETGKVKHRDQFVQFLKSLYDLYECFKKRLVEKEMAYSGMLMRDLYMKLQESPKKYIKPTETFVFVGLNALTKVEEEILKIFKDEGSTLFYWDYRFETFYKQGKALYFKASNLDNFPSPKEDEKDYINFYELTQKPEIEVYEVPSSIAQCRQIGTLLEREAIDLRNEEELLNTAIVLPDEQLLLPMLNNIPQKIQKLNVTMGYPVGTTAYMGFIEALAELYTNAVRGSDEKRDEVYFSYLNFTEILSQYVLQKHLSKEVEKLTKQVVHEHVILVSQSWIEEKMKKWTSTEEETQNTIKLVQLLFNIDPEGDGEKMLNYFKKILEFLIDHELSMPDPNGEDKLEDESITSSNNNDTLDALVLPEMMKVIDYQIEILEELNESAKGMGDDTKISPQMTANMLLTILREQTIPFVGEPLEGLQIMGILETRGLDFETLFIPDAQEDVLPPKRVNPGLIPYTLRLAYNLPTYEWHERVRAYHFFRLALGAKRIIFSYDTRKSSSSSGEVSRFIQYLEYICGIDVHYKTSQYTLQQAEHLDDHLLGINREKIASYIDSITNPSRLDGTKYLSASSINTYLTCPRKFYYSYILDIKEDKGLQEILDPALIGTIIHDVLNKIYSSMPQLPDNPSLRIIDSETIKKWLEGEKQYELEKLTKRAYKDTVFKNAESNQEPLGLNRVYINNALRQIKNILRHEKEDHTKDKYFIGGEQAIYLSLPLEDGRSVNLQMKIDRMDLHNRKLRVVDYKTGRDDNVIKADKLKKIVPPIDYKITAIVQLLTYSYALDKIINEKQPFFMEMYSSSAYALDKTINEKKSLKDPTINFNEVFKDFEAEGTREIYPMIFSSWMSPADRYIKFNEADDATPYRDFHNVFKEVIQEILMEITDKENTFPACPQPGSYGACQYCHVKESCWALLYNLKHGEGDENE